MDYEEINALEIGKTLRELRGIKPLTAVAEDIEVSPSALTMYETGKRIPRDEIKIRLAKYYGEPVERIFYRQKQHETCCLPA